MAKIIGSETIFMKSKCCLCHLVLYRTRYFLTVKGANSTVSIMCNPGQGELRLGRSEGIKGRRTLSTWNITT